MLIEHEGARPRVHASAYVAPTAVLCGDVEVGADCRILFGAVLTAEDGPVRLGKRCIVMEHAVLRGRAAHPARLGDRVLIGPHAHVNGADVGDEAFVATGASLFVGSRLGAGAEIRINGVLHVNSVLADGAELPIGWIAVGDPAAMFPPAAHDEIWEIQRTLDGHRHRARAGRPRGRGRDGRAHADVRCALRAAPRRPHPRALSHSSSDCPGSSAVTATSGASAWAAARNGSSGARR
jgi:carbonic anhydrase/acetyltransferase-like protein (isoleucine patch superfamily)